MCLYAGHLPAIIYRAGYILQNSGTLPSLVIIPTGMISAVEINFNASPRPTLGVEWELALVDAHTWQLTNRADDLIAAFPELVAQASLHREFLSNTIELVTGICQDVPAAIAELHGLAEVVSAQAISQQMGLLSAGMHPTSQWLRQEVSPGDRYHTLLDRTQFWGRQMMIYGVHVHVGMPDRDRVLPVLNSFLRFFPHLQALSASSPFYAGVDTGYASNRTLLFQQLPTAGLPFQFEHWSQYEHYVSDLMATGVIDELKEVRWDIRPAPHLGTIEVRVCDAMPSLAEIAATTALTHCLLVDLDRRAAAGETLPTLPVWHVQENKWRAARYGTEAIIITDADNTELLVTDELLRLCDELADTAAELNCVNELAMIPQLVARGSSYQQQRAYANSETGGLDSVTPMLVDQLQASLQQPMTLPGMP